MESEYRDAEATAAIERMRAWGEDLALRVYTSNLLGRRPSLVLHGGGNTSVKSTARELTGESVDVLYVKGSGWDLSDIQPPGFPACRLAPLRALCRVAELSDEQMVAGLRSQMIEPSAPNPSVEALLHAFLPGKFVDHTHADAVLKVVDQPDAAERTREVWGDEALFVPYVMPGFVLAKRIVDLESELAGRSIMVLDKHGIFTWGDTAKESYERMIEAVTRAERYFEQGPKPVSLRVSGPDGADRTAAQRALSPLLRGALASAAEGRRMMIDWRDTDAILQLLAHPEARDRVRIGTATPDHVIRTKSYPLWLGGLDRDLPEAEQRSAIAAALAEYGTEYEQYFDEGVRARDRPGLKRLDRLPRLVAVPGLGVAALGKTRREARIAGDIYEHTAEVINGAFELGSYRPVGRLDAFDMEYWSLEQAKLKKGAAGAGALSGRIALVTGAASGIGRASAEVFAAAGAHVVVTDRDPDALGELYEQLRSRFGEAVASCHCDVTSASDVRAAFDAAVDVFGGIDIAISNAGSGPRGLLHTGDGETALSESLRLNFHAHQTVARVASSVLLAQGTGGCLLFNASKSAFNQGPEFGPYAVAKAATVALMKQYAVDLGPHAVRANAVNADRIRTAFFSGGVLEERARARGVSPDEYFRQNLLRRETTASDVAEAFLYLATAEATTGCVVTVDGGNAAAFPR